MSDDEQGQARISFGEQIRERLAQQSADTKAAVERAERELESERSAYRYIERHKELFFAALINSEEWGLRDEYEQLKHLLHDAQTVEEVDQLHQQAQHILSLMSSPWLYIVSGIRKAGQPPEVLSFHLAEPYALRRIEVLEQENAYVGLTIRKYELELE